jgi:hypothetical protein
LPVAVSNLILLEVAGVEAGNVIEAHNHAGDFIEP